MSPPGISLATNAAGAQAAFGDRKKDCIDDEFWHHSTNHSLRLGDALFKTPDIHGDKGQLTMFSRQPLLSQQSRQNNFLP
jgi:hypothetical protein